MTSLSYTSKHRLVDTLYSKYILLTRGSSKEFSFLLSSSFQRWIKRTITRGSMLEVVKNESISQCFTPWLIFQKGFGESNQKVSQMLCSAKCMNMLVLFFFGPRHNVDMMQTSSLLSELQVCAHHLY